jgi:neutral amino acid transport system ATP-binding protein
LTSVAERRNQLRHIQPRPGIVKPDPILTVQGVRRSFGGLVAVDVDHLEIQRGVVTALIGPNGAGKTTLFNLLTGFDRVDEGKWIFDGVEFAGATPYGMARAGMVRTFQLTKVLSRLTVMENMKLGATDQTGERFVRALVPWRWRDQESEIEARAVELLDRFNLDHMRTEPAGTLSGGQRKLLEVARSLMTRPRLILLDEPMAGVNPALTQSLLNHITALCSDETTVVFVEHDMDVVMDISDWVVVLAEGSVIAEGPPSAIGTDERVIEAYLGRLRSRAPESEETGK